MLQPIPVRQHRLPRLGAVVLLALLASGCASLPKADADIERALQSADDPGRLMLLRRQSELTAGVAFSGGNRVDLLRNGKETYAAITAALGAAKQRIDMESYEFDDGEGARVADQLIEKRRQGLAVNLIFDSWGSKDTSTALIKRLRDGGVQVLEFHPLTPASRVIDFAQHRDHRKILIVDNRVVVTGGVNISAVYRNPKPARPADAPPADAMPDPENEPWRDTDIRVEGPAVEDYERIFEHNWADQKGTMLAPPPQVVHGMPGELPLEVITNDPLHDEHDIYRSLLVAISLARKSVHLTTGFFTPPPALRRALHRAVQRGVDVKLLVPSHSDSELAVAGGRAYYDELLENGIAIYECKDEVLHAKTAVIDGEWSSVGSSNLDWRSIVLNDEITTIIVSPAFGQQMEVMFGRDINAARHIERADWQRRPFFERVHEWRARLIQYFL